MLNTIIGRPVNTACPDFFVMPLAAARSLSKLMKLMGDIAGASEPSWASIETVNVEIKVIEEDDLNEISLRIPTMLMTNEMKTSSTCIETLNNLNIYSKMLQELLFSMQYILFTGKNITSHLMYHYNKINRKTQILLTEELPF